MYKEKINLYNKICLYTIQCGKCESGLTQKYACIKKSKNFTQSLRNFVKMRYS